MRPLGNTYPANYTQPRLEPVLWGIDGLLVSYWGNLSKRLLEMIDTGIKDVTINDLPFTVSPVARGTYNATLNNYLVNLGADSRIKSPSVPSSYLQVKAAFIWSLGIFDAYEQASDVIRCIYEGEVEGEKLSRADLFADFVLEESFDTSDLDKLVTRARRKKAICDGQTLTGFEVGKTDLHAVIYDKTLKARKFGETWFFELWGLPVHTTARVWRVEFQFRRDALKPFKVETFDDLIESSPVLWDYATKKWLSMREVNGRNTTRRPVTTFWESVQSVEWRWPEELPKLSYTPVKLSERTDRQVINQVAGIITGHARRQKAGPIDVYNRLAPGIGERVRQKSGENQRVRFRGDGTA